MINIQVSAKASSNNFKVYWSIQLPASIAEKQFRPSSMKGVLTLEGFPENLSDDERNGIAELKALNILFCFDKGLKLLNTENLDTSRFHILCSNSLATNALRGGTTANNPQIRDLLHSSIPAATMFYGAKFNQLSQFEPNDDYHVRCDHYSIADIPDSLVTPTEIGFLSMTRKALESFTRIKVRKNPYQELSKILRTAHLTIKYQSESEREQRIQRSGYDGEIVCVENYDNEDGLRIIIPKRTSENQSGIESYSIVTLFYQRESNSHGNTLNGKTNSMITSQKSQSNYNVYESLVMYLEINREANIVTAQYGEEIVSIDLFKCPKYELNYIDAAFIALNLMHINVQPQKRIRVFTNEKIVVDAFNDIKAIDDLVDTNNPVSVKLKERITMLMYKTRLFANVRLSQKPLRPLHISANIEDYDKINFDVFGKVRRGEKLIVVKPHAFSSFIARALPEQIEMGGGKNPLSFFFKIIKYNAWSVVVEKDSEGLQHWYNFDTNSLLVIDVNESNNTLNVVTFWRGNKYDNPKYKDKHPEKFVRVEKVIASSVEVKPIKIIN
ncbi:hypothetical protein [Photobacterium leiognathi]|uniref:hypothetical protein n=1 Tax=Photobacterium leiognathi TaxID=553611 RepID=UPI00298218FD|nr:hypothetical protein [Photobacterium leiognathi]